MSGGHPRNVPGHLLMGHAGLNPHKQFSVQEQSIAGPVLPEEPFAPAERHTQLSTTKDTDLACAHDPHV
jgi:hypothetical protein